MTTAIYLIISGALIGAGVSVFWRDLRSKRRDNFVSERDVRPAADPDIEITIEHNVEPEPVRRALPSPPRPPPMALRPIDELYTSSHSPSPSPRYAGGEDRAGGRLQMPEQVLVPHPAPLPTEEWEEADTARAAIASPAPPAPVVRTAVDAPRQGARLALEQQWSALQPAIATGVERSNVLLAPVRLFIGPVGEPSWSYKNKGYGAYRRLLMAGESLAWLRLELFGDGQLRASVKAHREDKATINASADMAAADLDGNRAGELFSQCLQQAAAYAARKLRDADQEESEQAWGSVDALVTAALKATNGALAQTGAQINSLAPAAWESELRHHRMALSVEVNGDDVARMHIERLPHEMEVAVGVRDPQLAALARRRRIPVDGMTIHALAELIASCAWPAIARFRDIRRQA
jgi:hypothetical protein